jgi:tetratricopeptide (TPR) repeat protein
MSSIKQFLWASLFVSLISGCSLTPENVSQPDPQNTKNNETSGDALAQPKEAMLLAKNNRFKALEPAMSRALSRDYKLALSRVKANDYAQALSLLKPYLTDTNKNSSVWVLFGDIAAKQQQDTKAVMGHYQKALEINPNNYWAHNRLAILLTRQGEFEQALGHYQNALDSWPGFTVAYLNRGILLDMYMGKKQQALKDYQTYQGLMSLTQGQPNKKVRGWIVDLSRQLKQQG